MTKKIFAQSVPFWVAGLVILIDQYIKYLVRANLAVGEQWEPIQGLGPYFRLLHIENNGAAFGMFQSGGMLFTVIAVVVSAIIIYYAARLEDGQWSLRFVLGLMLGGAIGNLIDRLVNGPVTDFFNVLGFLNTPIFNIADLSITIGVIVLVLLMWRESREAKPTPSAPVSSADQSS
jgi:signal peptidase II